MPIDVGQAVAEAIRFIDLTLRLTGALKIVCDFKRYLAQTMMNRRIWMGMRHGLIGIAIAIACYGLAVPTALAHGGEDHSRPSPVKAIEPQTKARETQVVETEAALEATPQAGEIQLPPSPVSEPAIAAETPRSLLFPAGELIFMAMLAMPVGLVLLRDRAQMSKS